LILNAAGDARVFGSGLLAGNAVHEECERVAALIDPTFSINAMWTTAGG